jgi:hypothetical protein
MPASHPSLADIILKLLPPDGTPVLNRVVRTMLARELEKAIDPDAFFAALDVLQKKGRIGRLRGQGGQVFALQPESRVRAEPATEPAEAWSEVGLMEPLRAYLDGEFRKGLDLPAEAVCIVHDTSRIGQPGARWARPDFILVSAMRFRLMPGAQLDVHSFELKTETGVTDLAVYEALAQTRFTHFGHLVWHLPEGSKAEAKLAEIEQQCDQHGVGLIRMRDPKRPESCEILLDPERKPTLPATVDGFLEARLTDKHRQDILCAITGAGA